MCHPLYLLGQLHCPAGHWQEAPQVQPWSLMMVVVIIEKGMIVHRARGPNQIFC